MNRRAFLTTTGAALAAGAALRGSSQAKVPDGRVDDILALVRRKMTEYHVPGVGLGLWHDQTLHLHGVGVTSLDDPRPVTPDTLFTIASISKTMTATAVMRLVEEGRLDLHAPVRKALPEFQVRDEAASASVTPWHLLTHTPGWEGQLTTDDCGAEALTHFVSTIMPALPQLAPPGRVWSYNNAGFALSGRLLEVVTGRPVHDALRDLVFAPLGLPRTFTRLTEAMTFPVTLGHRDRDGATEVIRPFQTTSSTTAGGVLTSLSDLMRYARFHLGDVVPRRRLPAGPAPGGDADGAGPQGRYRRRDGDRLAPPPSGRHADAGARRHAQRPLPADRARALAAPGVHHPHQPRGRVAPGAGRGAGHPAGTLPASAWPPASASGIAASTKR